MNCGRFTGNVRKGQEDHAAYPRRGRSIREAEVTHAANDAERRVGPRDQGVVGFHKTLRKADGAAGLDHVALDREPLPDLRGADKVDASPIVSIICSAHLLGAAIRYWGPIADIAKPTRLTHLGNGRRSTTRA
jgi:hypothetical protein